MRLPFVLIGFFCLLFLFDNVNAAKKKKENCADISGRNPKHAAKKCNEKKGCKMIGDTCIADCTDMTESKKKCEQMVGCYWDKNWKCQEGSVCLTGFSKKLCDKLSKKGENCMYKDGLCRDYEVCTEELKECPDGSNVVRDPFNGCEWKPCPVNDVPDYCCKDMIPECLACKEGLSKKEYCTKNPDTMGCAATREENCERCLSSGEGKGWTGSECLDSCDLNADQDTVCHDNTKGSCESVLGDSSNPELFCFVSCWACQLCEKVIPALVATGSVGACDVACVGIVEAVGGGPEDPIADAVAAACPPICSAVFGYLAGKSAEEICNSVIGHCND